jgi:hypothetical protein
VSVAQPEGRDVYVDGVYDEAAEKIPFTFMLQAGSHKFETLNANRAVDFRGRVTDLPNGSDVSISLVPVNPPEPT